MTKRTSRYFPLKFVIECSEPGKAFFEPIAAFNLEQVARSYCEGTDKQQAVGFRYRVVERHSDNYKPIARYPDDGNMFVLTTRTFIPPNERAAMTKAVEREECAKVADHMGASDVGKALRSGAYVR